MTTVPMQRPQTRAGGQVRERGFAVLEQARAPEDVHFFRERLAAVYDGLGRPGTYANPPLEPVAKVEISRVGMVLHELGAHCPEFAARLLVPEHIAIVRDVLGEDMHLEYTCAVLCNDDRPFFPWHMHVGGVDNITYRKASQFPILERCERLLMLTYLDDLDEENGTLRVHPHAVGAPTLPPHDPTLERWDDEVELRCTRGTVVLLDECTWHAAGTKRSRGLRAFMAFYFTAASAPATSWLDRSFENHTHGCPLLGSVLPRRHEEAPSVRAPAAG